MQGMLNMRDHMVFAHILWVSILLTDSLCTVLQSPLDWFTLISIYLYHQCTVIKAPGCWVKCSSTALWQAVASCVAFVWLTASPVATCFRVGSYCLIQIEVNNAAVIPNNQMHTPSSLVRCLLISVQLPNNYQSLCLHQTCYN